jgi:preprotein translocase subunit Sec61beta
VQVVAELDHQAITELDIAPQAVLAAALLVALQLIQQQQASVEKV